MEDNSKASSFELEKYKLLVNESDVITNLMIKLCNKLANTENLIKIMQLKQSKQITVENEGFYNITGSQNEEIVKFNLKKLKLQS